MNNLSIGNQSRAGDLGTGQSEILTFANGIEMFDLGFAALIENGLGPVGAAFVTSAAGSLDGIQSKFTVIPVKPICREDGS